MHEAIRAPWLRSYDRVPATLTYSQRTMANEVYHIAEMFPDHIAYSFMGKKTTYREAVRQMEICAKAMSTPTAAA